MKQFTKLLTLTVSILLFTSCQKDTLQLEMDEVATTQRSPEVLDIEENDSIYEEIIPILMKSKPEELQQLSTDDGIMLTGISPDEPQEPDNPRDPSNPQDPINPSWSDIRSTLFDLRDLPVNILVAENPGGRYLTAKRNTYKRWFKRYYVSAPAIFADKQEENNTTSQTFYLSYLMGGKYAIKTQFTGKEYYMIPGHYKSAPDDVFLFGVENPDDNYAKIFTFTPADTAEDAFYLENFQWDSDKSNPSNVWQPALGCNKSSRSYFDKYRNSKEQQFTIVPTEGFEIERIEYHNDNTAILTRIPDFIVTWTTYNNTKKEQQVSTNFGQSASKTSNFSFSKSISFSVNGTFSLKIPCFVKADGTFTTTTTTTATWGKSETFQDTRNYNFQIVVLPGTKVIAQAQVTRYLMEVRYTAYLKSIKTGRIVRLNGLWKGIDCTDIVTSYTEYDLNTNKAIRTTVVDRAAD